MKKKLFLTPALLLAMAFPAAAEIISLTELSSYLNGLRTAQASFTQLNGDGSQSTGTFYLRRPGRARFEYNSPDETLVMAGGGQVAIFDGKSNTGPEQYPLRRTPLSIILARRVNLNDANMVVDHREDGSSTIVTARDPRHAEYGNIQLVFSDNPVQLRQWIITDGSGNRTVVNLDNLVPQNSLSSLLFSIPHEVNRRNGD
ncbi:LolA family protein [Halocynthiibacter namhaensis]|uniref:LolA family protein n=1 Tax=Halocynthiibacter namhaensis TaxID=1290553 RepID=UPI0005796BED|nr:outer membrane lipoprotein carrier protein LolA [Halocynthiibacter namhaensis]